MNTKAGAVAAELRRIADVLDKNAEVDIPSPCLEWWFGGTGSKDEFISVARVFPRPFDKGSGLSGEQIELTHESEALRVYARIDRSRVCKLVHPATDAVYECEPLLSQTEEDSL